MDYTYTKSILRTFNFTRPHIKSPISAMDGSITLTYTVKPKFFIVLVGSMETETAPPWQEKVADMLKDLPIEVVNRHPNDFDPNLKQDPYKRAKTFGERIRLDMDIHKWIFRYRKSGFITVYFHPSTKSEPLDLVMLDELGLLHEKLIVCCPDGYFNKGGVQEICQRREITLIETYKEFEEVIRKKMEVFCASRIRRCMLKFKDVLLAL